MSWTGTAEIENTDDIYSIEVSVGNEEVREEQEEAVAVAKNVAADIWHSGVIGDYTKKYRVNISGHSNKNHEPTSKWANDCITVSISQL